MFETFKENISKENVSVINGQSASGKTLLMLKLALEQSYSGKKVVFLSNEMTIKNSEKFLCSIISESYDIDKDKIEAYVNEREEGSELQMKLCRYGLSESEMIELFKKYDDYDYIFSDFLPHKLPPGKYVKRELLIKINNEVQPTLVFTSQLKKILRSESSINIDYDFGYDNFNVLSFEYKNLINNQRVFKVLYNGKELSEYFINNNLKFEKYG